MLGVDKKQPVYDFWAWLAKNTMDFCEYQYWLKSPFSLFFTKNPIAFLSILLYKIITQFKIWISYFSLFYQNQNLNTIQTLNLSYFQILSIAIKISNCIRKK